MRALLVLWDIDHTLAENHGINKEIYALAFELLTGRHAEQPAQTDGRTEPEIMLNMLAAHGIEASPGGRRPGRLTAGCVSGAPAAVAALPASLALP